MKFLVAGDWHSDLHEEAVRCALERLGHEVSAFSWHGYFRARAGWLHGVVSLAKRAENKYLAGPDLRRLNHELLEYAARERPDVVFVYRGTHVLPRTLRGLRSAVPRALLVGYNNDDPFAPGQFPLLFRHFLQGIPEYDLVFAYRHHNLDDFRLAGARRVELLRSWFVPERHHPVEFDAAEGEDYNCDVVFIGHYEDDGRRESLEEILRRGWRLRVFGPGWEALPMRSVLRALGPIRALRGEEYNKALCAAKIALCFLSKLNRDTYTRRCFEIPATRTMMLSEYTDDLATLFQPGVDAAFFTDRSDMLRKIERYLADDEARNGIAERGWRRVHEDGHDVVSRMRRVVEQIETVNKTR